MISAKKLVKMARKWQKFAAMRTKRISFHRNWQIRDILLSTALIKSVS
ncbi:hypothetical protein CsSME_00009076 [Camellia sinensis var. sinensis]